MRGDAIRETIWSAVIERRDGTVCCGVKIALPGGGPVELQMTNDEFYSLLRMMRETIGEVRRRQRIEKITKP